MLLSGDVETGREERRYIQYVNTKKHVEEL